MVIHEFSDTSPEAYRTCYMIKQGPEGRMVLSISLCENPYSFIKRGNHILIRAERNGDIV